MIGSIFYCNYFFIKNKKKQKPKQQSYRNVNDYLKRIEKGYFSYERIYKYLKVNGNPLELTPGGFVLCKILIGIIVFFISINNGFFMAIVMSIIGFAAPDIIYYLSNKNDMKKIRLELADVYDFLNIQTSAGVFIGSALTEAYLIVRSKRLKKAFAELCAEINLTKNIGEALDNFDSKFSSPEINSFVFAIKQSVITGRLHQALEDLSNSQKEINLILVQEQTNRIKINKDIIQLLMYIGILLTVFVGLLAEFSQNFNGIF